MQRLVAVPLRGPGQAGELGKEEPLEVHKDKHKVLPMGSNNPMDQYMLGAHCLESRFLEKDHRSWGTAS